VEAGESGNPSGRPKNRPISDLYAEFAQRPVPEKLRRALGLAKGATFAEAQTVSLFIAASNGNVQAAREIREGIEGKANERSKLGGIEEVVLHVVEERRGKKPEDSQDTTQEASPDTTDK
jgi:hypothetical protein